MKKTFALLLIVALLGSLLLLVPAPGGAAVAPSLSLDYSNLSFRDSICIKFAVKANVTGVSLLCWTSPQEEYVKGTEERQITTSKTSTINGARYRVFDYEGLAAKQMTDQIYVRAYAVSNGEAVYSEVRKYSILEYAYTALGKMGYEGDPSLHGLMRSMLDYGAEAQLYLDYRTDNLANEPFYYVQVANGTFEDGLTYGLYQEGDTVAISAPATDENGNAFSHWVDGSGKKVAENATDTYTVETANTTLCPIYEEANKSFTVTFVDHDGTELKVDTVEEGQGATAPADPVRNGYTFIGWDKTFDQITADIVVTATYRIEDNQVCINYTDNGNGTTTAKFSINGNVNIAMLELQLRFVLENAAYAYHSILASGSADANYVNGVFYFSFMSVEDVTVDTDLFSLTFESNSENVSIVFEIVDSCVSDGTFTNITTANVVGTAYNR